MLYMTKCLSNKLYLKKQLYGLCVKEGKAVLEHLNFFNKIISELLGIDVKIYKEDKVLILLSLLSKSKDHIVTTIFYRKEKFILEEFTITLLSDEIRKKLNQDEEEGLGLVVLGRKGREGKKSPDLSKACHFCHQKSY